jgi:hypothetical protein
MEHERVSGACLCGAVAFTIELPTLFCAHCHCRMCRRNHGACYVTWLGIASDKLAIDAGRDALVRYRSSQHGSRSFCARCGSSLFCESTQHPDRVDIPLANMDAPIDRLPQFHVYFDHGADWTVVSDDLPRLGGESGAEPLGRNEP